MIFEFVKYFSHYVVFAKTRQRLLFLSSIGLMISAFALLVVQSTMGGLQSGLINRSKETFGSAEIYFADSNQGPIDKTIKRLNERDIPYMEELELELLVKNGPYLSPVVAHGVKKNSIDHFFLKDAHFKNGPYISYELASKLNTISGDVINLISPGYSDFLFGDIPRIIAKNIGSLYSSDVPEANANHIWLDIDTLQNLIRKNVTNKISIYGQLPEDLILSFKKEFKDDFKTWEQKNSKLVWALKLETTVMLFLFVGMTFLVSLCITSGLMLFFDKIKGDLSSFWILGLPQRTMEKGTFSFLLLIGPCAIFLGIIVGLIFLECFRWYGGDILPDVFVDQKIPIKITFGGILISFFIPFVMSSLFSYLSLKSFQRENDYLDFVRSV